MSDWTRYDVCPVPKPRQTRADVWRKRPAVMRYRAFADELRLAVRHRMFSIALPVHILFVMPAPKCGMSRVGKHHTSRPDVDNLLKAFTDALWPEEDSHVWDVRATKVWGKSGAIWVLSLEPADLPKGVTG